MLFDCGKISFLLEINSALKALSKRGWLYGDYSMLRQSIGKAITARTTTENKEI
jgi:hypothetical protein